MLTSSQAKVESAAAATPTRRAELVELTRHNLPREHGFEPLEIEGAIPPELEGTLYRNGPGIFELFGKRYDHAFEGDGALSAVRFEAGKVTGAARITESAGLAAERAAGKQLYGFATSRARRLWNTHITRRGKNTANTNVVAWQGRLFALMEAAGPTEIDPADLATIGETDLDGVVLGAFSAHPHEVRARDALYNFGIRYGKNPALFLYELPDTGSAHRLGTVPLPVNPMLHDFIATERHLVFFLSPAVLELRNFMLQRGSLADLFRWDPSAGTEVIVVPIDAPDDAVRFEVDPFYQWHFANAYEAGSDIVIDFVRYPNFDSFYAFAAPEMKFPPGSLHRAVVTPAERGFRCEPLDDTASEFPRINPDRQGREHRFTWLVTGETRGLACFDHARRTLERFDLPPHQLSSEAVMVPRPDAAGERDGFLLSLLFDAEREASGMAVFDAERLAAGPLGIAWFDHRIPITFHGNWIDANG